MRYTGVNGFTHDQKAVTGVLLTNMGTPDEPTPKALKRYLKEFLWDPRVVEVPRPIWWCILNGIILNTRPRRSAAAYQKIWSEQGAPLRQHTQAQSAALRERLQRRFGDNVLIEFAMRYGNPAISGVIGRMQQAGVRRLLVLPLYPQYSGATTASTFDAIAEDFRHRRWLPELRMVNHYHDDPGYIEALAASVRAHWQQHGRARPPADLRSTVFPNATCCRGTPTSASAIKPAACWPSGSVWRLSSGCSAFSRALGAKSGSSPIPMRR